MTWRPVEPRTNCQVVVPATGRVCGSNVGWRHGVMWCPHCDEARTDAQVEVEQPHRHRAPAPLSRQ